MRSTYLYNDITTDVHIAGNTLNEVQSFKYLGEIIREEGSKPEVLTRIVQASSVRKVPNPKSSPESFKHHQWGWFQTQSPHQNRSSIISEEASKPEVLTRIVQTSSVKKLPSQKSSPESFKHHQWRRFQARSPHQNRSNIISEEGSKPEVLTRIVQATAALSSLKIVWKDRNITLDLRSMWCVLSWYWSSCMHAKPGHSPLTFNVEYKQWRWDATEDSSTYRIQSTSQMRRYATGSSMQFAHTKTCLQPSRGILVSQRLSCKKQWMVAVEGVVRDIDRKITSKNAREYFRIVKGIEGSEMMAWSD